MPNATRMKRTLRTNYNIEKVCDVNQISLPTGLWEIDLEQAYQALSDEMKRAPLYYPPADHCGNLSAPSSIMFGGNFSMRLEQVLRDCLAFGFSLVVEKYVRIPLSLPRWAFVFGLPISGRASGFLPHRSHYRRLCHAFCSGIMTNAVRDLTQLPLTLGWVNSLRPCSLPLALCHHRRRSLRK